jgi:hypothetical protein
MALSRQDRYLATLATQHRGDWTLDRLVKIADDGLGMAVTLILDSGHILTGLLAPSKDWTAHVDQLLDEALKHAEDHARGAGRDEDAGKWEELRRAVKENSLQSELEQSLRVQDRVREQTSDVPTNELGHTDLDQIPDEQLTERVIEYAQRRSVLTLKDAVMAWPMGRPQNVPGEGIIRVFTQHVAAWFPGRAGFEGMEHDQGET